ncbi:hypothetical protein HYH84_12695 [Clostridium botulinum]|uniref:hypothetical protein n=1 Tax=Clostridium botulinum TaxID=1491 RepID=UPI0013F8CF56|nr:hypothetical protein [Clostridium botulinum]MBY6761794.1 hypothetical protein [Clostridium botulinum]NFG27256.1 hypothetical protein [Clostridium botulinum]
MGEIYKKYLTVVGENNYFSENEKKKILYHICKNAPQCTQQYSIEDGNTYNQYWLYSMPDGYLLQLTEEFNKDEPIYSIIINANLKCEGYNYFGTDKFNSLLTYF